METVSQSINDSQLKQSYRDVARENYAASRLMARAPKAVFWLLIQIVVFNIALLIPQTQQIFQLPPAVIIPLMAIYALNSIMTSYIMHRCGPLSAFHIRMELLEAFIVHILAGAFIYFAPDVVTPYWMFFIMLIVTGAPMYPLTRLPFYFTITTTVVLAILYGYESGYDDAFVAFFFGATVFILGWRSISEQDRFLHSQAEKQLLQTQLKQHELNHERLRISRELHDGVGSELTSLLWNVRSAVGQATNSADLESTTRRITEELRTIIWDLRDDPASWQSFCQRMEEITVNLARGTEIIAEFHCHDDMPRDNLEVDAAHELLRITQELVHNAVRHAAPEHIDVTLSLNDNQLKLEVRDDGRGFVEPQISERGILNVRRRAQLLNGHFNICTDEHGTRAVITTSLTNIMAPSN